MKYKNGKLAMNGDAVAHVTKDGYAVVGTVANLYDRMEELRVSGYPLRVKAAECLLAADAWAAYVELEAAKASAASAPEIPAPEAPAAPVPPAV